MIKNIISYNKSIDNDKKNNNLVTVIIAIISLFN